MYSKLGVRGCVTKVGLNTLQLIMSSDDRFEAAKNAVHRNGLAKGPAACLKQHAKRIRKR
jgi:hypothetical protein